MSIIEISMRRTPTIFHSVIEEKAKLSQPDSRGGVSLSLRFRLFCLRCITTFTAIATSAASAATAAPIPNPQSECGVGEIACEESPIKKQTTNKMLIKKQLEATQLGRVQEFHRLEEAKRILSGDACSLFNDGSNDNINNSNDNNAAGHHPGLHQQQLVPQRPRNTPPPP